MRSGSKLREPEQMPTTVVATRVKSPYLESAHVHLPEHAASALLEPRQLRKIQGCLRGCETSSHDPSRLPAPDLVDPSARSDLAQRGQFLDQLRSSQGLAHE